jgi:hypothetical protein
MQKYGHDKFSFNIIEQSLDPEYCLNVLEPNFIKQYNCLCPNGYNLLSGGGPGTFKLSDDVKNRISETVSKIWQDPDYRERISTMAKNKWLDADYRNRMEKIFKSTKFKNKISKITKHIWSDKNRGKNNQKLQK